MWCKFNGEDQISKKLNLKYYIMKRFNVLFLILFLLLLSCKEDIEKSPIVIHLKTEIDILKSQNQNLRDSMELLSYPASERIVSIKKLVEDNQFGAAQKEIAEIKALFPRSQEIAECVFQEKVISDKKEKLLEEAKRQKALGFKAIQEKKNIEVGYNKISIGSFSISNTFTFDAYDDRYFYKTADRDSKYVSARISISSKDKNPNLPIFHVYSVDGDELIYEKQLLLKFARWEDYGSYLGNYHDNGNDFAKTSTIPFKVGVELNNTLLSKPLVIVCHKQNVMSRIYNRYDNPPVSYLVSSYYSPQKVLTLSDLNDGYELIYFLNRNKL